MQKPKVIALEEHFTSPKLRELRGEKDTPLQRKLDDLGALRLREMDEAGIDLQVISENNPATQNSTPKAPSRWRAPPTTCCTKRCAQTLRALPVSPRCRRPIRRPPPTNWNAPSTKLDFKGAMIMGLTHGRFMDDKQFRPIFERAAALDVPLYIHPTPPHPAVNEAYFKDYPVLAGAPLGFTIETLTHTCRLIVSGLFDEFPALKIIVGHLGETAPFLMWRTSDILSERLKMPKSFADYYRRAFLAHHQRRVFRHRAHLLDCRDGRRTHLVFRRLAVPAQFRRQAMDGRRPGQRAGSRLDLRRQCDEAAQAIKTIGGQEDSYDDDPKHHDWRCSSFWRRFRTQAHRLFRTKPSPSSIRSPPAASAIFWRACWRKSSAPCGSRPCIVDNKPGIAGTIGVAKSCARRLHADLDLERPHHPRARSTRICRSIRSRISAGITQIASVPVVMIVTNELPAKNLKELIALAKEKPGTLNFTSAGLASSNYIAGELFKQTAEDRHRARAVPRHAGTAHQHHARRLANEPGVSRQRRAVHQLGQSARAGDRDAPSAAWRCRMSRPSPRPACRSISTIHGSASWRQPARRRRS